MYPLFEYIYDLLIRYLPSFRYVYSELDWIHDQFHVERKIKLLMGRTEMRAEEIEKYVDRIRKWTKEAQEYRMAIEEFCDVFERIEEGDRNVRLETGVRIELPIVIKNIYGILSSQNVSFRRQQEMKRYVQSMGRVNHEWPEVRSQLRYVASLLRQKLPSGLREWEMLDWEHVYLSSDVDVALIERERAILLFRLLNSEDLYYMTEYLLDRMLTFEEAVRRGEEEQDWPLWRWVDYEDPIYGFSFKEREPVDVPIYLLESAVGMNGSIDIGYKILYFFESGEFDFASLLSELLTIGLPLEVWLRYGEDAAVSVLEERLKRTLATLRRMITIYKQEFNLRRRNLSMVERR